MSISGIGSSPSLYQNCAQGQFRQLKEDFVDLETSLTPGPGDLSAAQQAFATLTQDLQTVGQAQNGQQTGASSQLHADLAVIGTALQSSDLAGAQKAFATLTQDIQTLGQAQNGQAAGPVHRYRRHHHSGSVQNMTGTLGTDLAAMSTALQSGDLAAARKAFATLMQDLGNGSARGTAATSGNGSSTRPQVAVSGINMTV